MNLALGGDNNLRAGQETVIEHPYIDCFDNGIAEPLTTYAYADMVEFVREVAEDHASNPVDALVGEDVSGRIPTLIAHHFLRHAARAGHVSEVPGTFFMASGRILGDNTRAEQKEAWQINLSKYAAQLVGSLGISQVAIITEYIYSGDSVKRLIKAFQEAGASTSHYEAVGKELYLGNQWISRQASLAKLAVGVEKHESEPVSLRHTDFDPQEISQLRYFIKDYSKAIYLSIFGELPPAKNI